MKLNEHGRITFNMAAKVAADMAYNPGPVNDRRINDAIRRLEVTLDVDESGAVEAAALVALAALGVSYDNRALFVQRYTLQRFAMDMLESRSTDTIDALYIMQHAAYTFLA